MGLESQNASGTVMMGDLSDHDSGVQFSIRVASCPIEEL